MKHPLIESYNNIFPTIGERVYIDKAARIIGNVTLGNDVSVFPMAVIRGDVNTIHIGDASNVQDGAILHATHDGPYAPGGKPLFIGREVTIGHQAVLHACYIEDRVLIGIGARILDGVYVESDVMIGAGSIVPPNKRLLSGYLYFGNPVQAVRHLTSDELQNLAYSAKHYVQLKNDYLKNAK